MSAKSSSVQSTLGFDATRAVLAAAEGTVFTAAAIHVRLRGDVVWESALGVVAPGGAPATTGTRFDLASITKIFTATALLSLFDERRVALDDPVVSVVAEFAGQDGRRKDVTFRHLLAHTSGLPAHVSFRDEVGAAAVLARVCATPLASAPGETVTYSDLGYILLGAAIERAGGASLATAVEHRIEAPLRLSSLGYRPSPEEQASIVCTERDSWRGRLVQGEVHDENCWSMGGISGHAGLFGAAADVAELGEAYRLGGATTAGRALSRHSAALAVDEAAASDDERRGLGWALRTAARQSCGSRFGARSFGHTGYTGTSLWVDPDAGLVVALLTNRVYFTRDPVPIFELRAAVHDAVVEDLADAEAPR